MERRAALAPKLARRGEKAVLSHLLEALVALERDWGDPARRERAQARARELAEGAEAAGIGLPPGSRDLARRLAGPLAAHELAALVVPLERALERSLRDQDWLPRSDLDAARADAMPVCVVADSLRSAWNVGGLFRSCECFGVPELLLTGYTPDPGDARVASAAMGTERRVAWSRQRSAADALRSLRARGCFTLALETDDRYPPLAAQEIRFPCALLLGNERFGLAASVLTEADARARIPTAGAKASLNVVSALAIALYELRGRYEASQPGFNPRRRRDR